tara:strand:+ start:726 stop:923 length:198 start_codon:yes stop_codon:yes gene_type:complete
MTKLENGHMTTPKERYDARMKLKRAAHDPDWKTDEIIEHEYFANLVERFVVAVESISTALKGTNK